MMSACSLNKRASSCLLLSRVVARVSGAIIVVGRALKKYISGMEEILI